jgi:hypothetical protein
MRMRLLSAICILDNGSFESLLKHILNDFKNNLSRFFFLDLLFIYF